MTFCRLRFVCTEWEDWRLIHTWVQILSAEILHLQCRKICTQNAKKLYSKCRKIEYEKTNRCFCICFFPSATFLPKCSFLHSECIFWMQKFLHTEFAPPCKWSLKVTFWGGCFVKGFSGVNWAIFGDISLATFRVLFTEEIRSNFVCLQGVLSGRRYFWGLLRKTEIMSLWEKKWGKIGFIFSTGFRVASYPTHLTNKTLLRVVSCLPKGEQSEKNWFRRVHIFRK